MLSFRLFSSGSFRDFWWKSSWRRDFHIFLWLFNCNNVQVHTMCFVHQLSIHFLFRSFLFMECKKLILVQSLSVLSKQKLKICVFFVFLHKNEGNKIWQWKFVIYLLFTSLSLFRLPAFSSYKLLVCTIELLHSTLHYRCVPFLPHIRIFTYNIPYNNA